MKRLQFSSIPPGARTAGTIILIGLAGFIWLIIRGDVSESTNSEKAAVGFPVSPHQGPETSAETEKAR